ncbi:241_t:CDS:1, partial [Scutellospora calospora]
NEWIAKLEKDMETHRADYGFIVATCENDKPIRPLDSRKKIYISGDNINIFIVAKIMRELLITKCNFETILKSDEKEQKLKNLKE